MPHGSPSAQAASIIFALSPERIAPYRAATHGDDARALRLYEWNMAVSGAFYEALGIMEVTLRNALARELGTFLGSDAHPWYDDQSGVLSAKALQDITKAKERVHRQQHAETPGRVIAELNFGFWRFLLASRYESSLWTPCLRHAFPRLDPQRRMTVYEPLDQLHTLRNRIAHHEPIHTRDLRADMLSIYRILNWISPDVRAWAVDLSRISITIARRPVSDVAHLD